MKPANILYSIIPSNPAAHIFTVTCTIRQPDTEGQVLWLPAWIPGSYMIRDFAKNIVHLRASDGSGDIKVTKLDKQTWRCAPCTGPLTVTYDVYAYDLSVRSAHLDTTHAYFNGSSVFVAVQGQEEQPVQVEIMLPTQDYARQWRVATTLPRIDTPLFAAGRYTAQNYEELIDHPVEMTDFAEIQFDVAGTPHHIVVSGRQQADLERLAKDVQQICESQVAVFGELPAMERYIFLLWVVGDGYGGLEHRNSCSLICSRKDLPVKNMVSASDGYITLLGLFSHEYFHTWNVKRIKPAEFIPYDLKQESHTRQLWAFEGITSYYDDLGLIRSGVIDDKKYFELLSKNITRVMRGSGRLKQNLRESSFDAWTKFYKQDENSPNAIVSYYAKGAMFALALDLKLRELTDNHKSLDDVMRRLWREYGKPGIGIDENTIQVLAEEVSGQPLADFFVRYLDTTEDLPLVALFAQMGLDLKVRIAETSDDMGGTPPKTATAPLFNLGAKFVADTQGAKILVILDDGDLQRAGLAANDVIIAINHLKANKDNLATLLAPFSAGDNVEVHTFRRDELMTFQVTLTHAGADAWYLESLSDVSAESKRRHWLQPESKANDGGLKKTG
ncbi:MAG: PDZ domain-containing protein [Gammaproteobacteria bacterium]|nr:PDZ domain-containing protein [Gammaproteobacteria bacterium]